MFCYNYYYSHHWSWTMIVWAREVLKSLEVTDILNIFHRGHHESLVRSLILLLFQTCGMFMENVKTLQSSKVILVPSWNYISHWMGGNKKFVNPLTPMSDQDRISPYYICTISWTQVMGIKKTINYGISNWCNTKFSKLTWWEFARQ